MNSNKISQNYKSRIREITRKLVRPVAALGVLVALALGIPRVVEQVSQEVDEEKDRKRYNNVCNATGNPADPKQEFWARLFPGSIRAAEFDAKFGTNYSGRKPGASRDISARDVSEARWGRGRYAGKTGDIFVDDPFFNPWTPGGSFTKRPLANLGDAGCRDQEERQDITYASMERKQESKNRKQESEDRNKVSKNKDKIYSYDSYKDERGRDIEPEDIEAIVNDLLSGNEKKHRISGPFCDEFYAHFLLAYLEDNASTEVAGDLHEKNMKPSVKSLKGTARMLYDRLQEAGLNPEVFILGGYGSDTRDFHGKLIDESKEDLLEELQIAPNLVFTYKLGIAYVSPAEKQFREKLNKAKKNVCEGMKMEYKDKVFTWDGYGFCYKNDDTDMSSIFYGSTSAVCNSSREYAILTEGKVVHDPRKETETP